MATWPSQQSMIRRISQYVRNSGFYGSEYLWVGSSNITLRGSKLAEMPPKAARAEGPLKGAAAPLNQSREAHRSARPLHSPEGGQSAAGFAADWPHEGA